LRQAYEKIFDWLDVDDGDDTAPIPPLPDCRDFNTHPVASGTVRAT
jgi:hypothetical protein